MELIQIYSQVTGFQLVCVCVGTIACFFTAALWLFMYWDMDEYEKKRTLYARIIAPLILVVCVLYVACTDELTIYTYYATDTSVLAEMLDNGYKIYSSDGSLYDLLKVVKN